MMIPLADAGDANPLIPSGPELIIGAILFVLVFGSWARRCRGSTGR